MDVLIDSISPQAQKQVQELVKKLNEGVERVIELDKAFKNITVPSLGKKAFEEVALEVAKSNKVVSDAEKLSRKLAKTETDRFNVNTKLNKSIIANRLETQRATKNLKQLAELNSKSTGAFRRQEIILERLRVKYKNLAISQGESSKEAKKVLSELTKLDKRIKRVSANAGQFQKNVGNYSKALGSAARAAAGLARSMGLVGGAFLIAGTIKNAIKIVKDFDQSQADLAAILGKSRTQISALTDQAKELGATTAFTATQVAQLQLELSKLGFNDSEILAAAEGVENLAIATGVDAARAAKLAGATIRGFALEASEANRVAAALAVSTTKSASSFETLEVALPKVSAIAKSFGFSLEDTTALLGGLQNAGFEASIAGTSLRQIFLQLADSNGKLAKRLGGGAKSFDELIGQFKKLEGEGIDLSEAFQLTNARSVAAFKVFLQGADDLKELRDSIVDVEDELKDLADAKLDSLQGDVTLLTSAWEGFILSVEDGEGALSRFARGAVQSITSLFSALTRLNETFDDTKKRIEGSSYKDLKETYVELGEEANAYAEIDKKIATNHIKNIKSQIQGQEKILEKYKNFNAFQKFIRGDARKAQQEIEKLNKGLFLQQGRLNAANEQLSKSLEKKETSDKIKEQEEASKKQIDIDKKKADQQRKDIFQLAKFRLENEIKTNKDISDNEFLSLEERLKANRDLVNLKGQLAVLEKDFAVKTAEGRETLITKAIEENRLKQKEAIKQGEEEKQKILKSSFEKRLNDLKTQERELKIKEQNEINDLKEKLLKQGATKEEIDKQVTEKQKEQARIRLSDQIEALKEELKAYAHTAEQKLQIEEELSKLKGQLIDLDLDGDIDTEKIDESLKIAADSIGKILNIDSSALEVVFNGLKNGFEDIGEAAEAFGQIATDVFANVIQASNERLENQIQNLEQDREIALAFAGDNAAAREQIEERFAERQKQIRQKQARNEKAQSLFNIGINTAVGVTKAISALNIPLSVLIGVIGAAQLAAVASTPIPQFKDGVRDFEGGLAVLGDGGVSEIVRTPDGKVSKTPSTDTLYNLPKGTDVFKNESEFNKHLSDIMSDNNIYDYGSAFNTRFPVNEININQNGLTKQDIQQAMTKALKGRPSQVTNIDKNGLSTYIQTEYSKTEILNNRASFKGETF